VGRSSKAFCLFGLGLVAALGIAHRPASSAPISLEHIGANKVGKFLAHEVSEEISTTDMLRVGQDADDGWKLVLLTLDVEGATFYSVVLVRKQFDDVFDQYVFAFHGTCAVEQLRSCARDIVGRVQEPIVQFESDWRDMSGAPLEPGRPQEAATSGQSMK
jgi:hypothetical protein